MNNLQQGGGVGQGSVGGSFQSTVGSLQQTQNLQGTGSQENVLGISSVLTQSNSSAEVAVDNSSTGGTTSSSAVTPLASSGFSVSPWFIILAGALVIIAGISFIWSQRNDMARL